MNKILLSLLAVSALSQVSFARSLAPMPDYFCNDSTGQTQLALSSAALRPGSSVNTVGGDAYVSIDNITRTTVESTLVVDNYERIVVSGRKFLDKKTVVPVQLICTRSNPPK